MSYPNTPGDAPTSVLSRNTEDDEWDVVDDELDSPDVERAGFTDSRLSAVDAARLAALQPARPSRDTDAYGIIGDSALWETMTVSDKLEFFDLPRALETPPDVDAHSEYEFRRDVTVHHNNMSQAASILGEFNPTQYRDEGYFTVLRTMGRQPKRQRVAPRVAPRPPAVAERVQPRRGTKTRAMETIANTVEPVVAVRAPARRPVVAPRRGATTEPDAPDATTEPDAPDATTEPDAVAVPAAPAARAVVAVTADERTTFAWWQHYQRAARPMTADDVLHLAFDELPDELLHSERPDMRESAACFTTWLDSIHKSAPYVGLDQPRYYGVSPQFDACGRVTKMQVQHQYKRNEPLVTLDDQGNVKASRLVGLPYVTDTRVGGVFVVAAMLDPRLRDKESALTWMNWVRDDREHLRLWFDDVAQVLRNTPDRKEERGGRIPQKRSRAED